MRYRTVTLAILLLEAVFVTPLCGQEATPGRIGLPQDWSARHVIFTNGASPATAALASRDPRAWVQWVRRTTPRLTRRAEPNLAAGYWQPPRPRPAPSFFNSRLDWAVSLGPNGGMALGESPAKFSFNLDETPDCKNDFVVFVINATPKAGKQANIVALNNLYSGPAPSLCSAAPGFLWSYAVGSGGISLSPVLSLDGKKVAFVENSTSHPTFDVLIWAAGQGRNATTGAVAPGGGSAVTRLDFTNTSVAGCFARPAADSKSSPFVDYDADVAYIGADNGVLYRIKEVFSGIPKLDYCILVSPGKPLTSPVFDFVSGKVFVSDGQSVFAFMPGIGAFMPAGSVRVAGRANSIVQSPIVDSTNGFVYVFSNHDLSNTSSIVSQMPVTLASRADAAIGPATSLPILAGDFDNGYYEIGPAAGSLYACGAQAGASARPALYRLAFNSATGVLNPVPAMANNRNPSTSSNLPGMCSGLAEFSDGTTDRLFVGVSSPGASRVMIWDITRPLTSSAARPVAYATNIGGSSAFTLDAVNPTRVSSIYFGTLAKSSGLPCGSGLFCAVKLSQTK